MLRAKLAGRVNYPDSLHLNGWMSSALARRTRHQFKQEGETNRKFWAGRARHCFVPIWSNTALLLLSSLLLSLCWRAASTPSSVCLFLLFPPSPRNQLSGCLLAALPWLLPVVCQQAAVPQGTLFQSFAKSALCSSSDIMPGPHWNEGSWLSVCSSAQTSLCHQREVRSPSLLLDIQFMPHLYNLWNRSDKKSMRVPWHEGHPLFYFQQLLWKQLVLHELFAFQS